MLKLFCSTCHEFMREVDPIHANKLTGSDVCPKCREDMENAVQEIRKMSNRSQMSIQKKADKAIAELEMAILHALKLEK
jgi:hypothetical protein